MSMSPIVTGLVLTIILGVLVGAILSVTLTGVFAAYEAVKCLKQRRGKK